MPRHGAAQHSKNWVHWDPKAPQAPAQSQPPQLHCAQPALVSDPAPPASLCARRPRPASRPEEYQPDSAAQVESPVLVPRAMNRPLPAPSRGDPARPCWPGSPHSERTATAPCRLPAATGLFLRLAGPFDHLAPLPLPWPSSARAQPSVLMLLAHEPAAVPQKCRGQMPASGVAGNLHERQRGFRNPPREQALEAPQPAFPEPAIPHPCS